MLISNTPVAAVTRTAPLRRPLRPPLRPQLRASLHALRQRSTTQRRQAAGFTLIELLVAVTVGMAMTLAITLMLIRSEAGRRALTSINDVASGGAYLSFVMDRSIRSAGSGYTQIWGTAAGCQLAVARSGTQILPRSAAFPAPFASLPTTQRLLPVLVYAGAGANGSDILAVNTGASGLGESPLRVLPGSATGTGVRVPATIGLREGDLGLVVQNNGTCLIQQVAAGFVGAADQQLNFGGLYAAASVGTVSLSDAGGVNEATVAQLGNVAGNRPVFMLMGVGANDTLMQHDLLRLDGVDGAIPMSNGVADMRVLYGVDTNNDKVIDNWVSPSTAPYDAASLGNGSKTAADRAATILAVRVGLLTHNTSPERDDVSAATVSLFPEMGSLKQTRTLTPDERKLRWRVLDFTVPLRNVMLKP
jgi:type IV pilus assembly protein PilW